ncbi:MAG: GerMN domain-containing protein [Spirochaetales bacterium]
MGQSDKKRRASIGFLFWIAFILLVIVIFLANRSNIEQVVENTGIVDVIRDRVSTNDEPAGEDSTNEEPDSEPLVLFDSDPEPPAREPAPVETTEDTPAAPETNDPEAPQPRVTEPEPEPAPETPATRVTPTRPEIRPQQREPSPDPTRPNRLSANLYFIKVADNGRTYPQKVVRPVYYASSPLTETINELLAGPSSSELENGLLNLIPQGSRLLSAAVRDGVAYLNFNQEFRFNNLGAEGTVGQLMQIIYSSTEFPTVQRVQFLIEGEQLDYLGGDGIFVGEPLGRDAFS